MACGKIQYYFEVGFIKEFIENISNPSLSVSDNDAISLINYRKLLFENEIFVDKLDKIDELVKINKENQFYKRLYKNITSACISEKSIDNIDFEKINPHAVFFLSDTHECRQLEEDYGMLFISNETKNEKAKIIFGFEESKISITERDIHNYDFISKYRHPCNCLIINDAYLLSDDENDDNIIELLEKLLPNTLKRSFFQLLIISDYNKKRFNIETHYSSIRKKLEKLRPSYPIKLKIIGKRAHHNRNIITNYIRINVGHKFALFKKEKLKVSSDTFTVSSIVGNADEKKVISDLVDEYRKIEKDVRNIGSETAVFPSDSDINRLLNQENE